MLNASYSSAGGSGSSPQPPTCMHTFSGLVVNLQDCFELELIPADSDYSLFSGQKHGHLPGLDVAFLLDAAAYHTHCDTLERIRPGTVQVCRPIQHCFYAWQRLMHLCQTGSPSLRSAMHRSNAPSLACCVLPRDAGVLQLALSAF